MLFLVVSGLFAIVGHVAFVKSLSIAPVSRVFPTTNGLYIMTSIVGTIIIADETVTWRTVAGGVLVLGGIYVLSVRRQQESAQQEDESFGLLAFALCVLTGVAWSGSVLVQNDVVETMSPVLANVVRMMAMVTIGLTVIALGSDRRVPHGSGRDHLVIFGSGLVNGVSALLFMSSLKFASPASVVVLNSTSPLFAVPMAFLVLHERMTRKVLSGHGRFVRRHRADGLVAPPGAGPSQRSRHRSGDRRARVQSRLTLTLSRVGRGDTSSAVPRVATGQAGTPPHPNPLPRWGEGTNPPPHPGPPAVAKLGPRDGLSRRTERL